MTSTPGVLADSRRDIAGPASQSMDALILYDFLKWLNAAKLPIQIGNQIDIGKVRVLAKAKMLEASFPGWDDGLRRYTGPVTVVRLTETGRATASMRQTR